jgi:hypothetical protein
MLNNKDFIDLGRRLWREGNPLCDELVSTRDELLFLLKQASKVMEKYSHALSAFADEDDIEYFLEWDNFADTIDNLHYHLGE